MNDIVVWDIGARGPFPLRWRPIRDCLHFIGIDGDGQSIGSPPFSIRRFERREAMLSGKAGPRTFFQTREPGCSSLYRPDLAFMARFPYPERFQIVHEAEVPAILAGSLDLALPDFIKADIQGSELDVLRSLPGDVFDSVMGLEVEASFVPLYVGQPLFGDLDHFLRSRHFELADLNKRYWREHKSGQLRCIFADALYFKHPDHIRRLDVARRLGTCYRLSLRQTAAHAWQWLERYFSPHRPYDADQQIGR